MTAIKKLSNAQIELSTDTWTIVKIRDQQEAIEYGRPSWCTGRKDNNWFDRSYSTDKGELFVFYKNVRKRPQYQLFLSVRGGVELRDAQNQYVCRTELANLDPLIEQWLTLKHIDIPPVVTGPTTTTSRITAGFRAPVDSVNYVTGDLYHDQATGALMMFVDGTWVNVETNESLPEHLTPMHVHL